VFSVAATWLILGDDGIKMFEQVRIDATSRLKKLGKLPPKQTIGTFFHDGTEVLDEILQWHKYLRSSLYKHDYITQDVLELIESDMLVGDREKRADANRLQHKLKKITTKWQTSKKPGPDLSATILATIERYNQESSTHKRFNGKSDPASWFNLDDYEAERRAMIRKDQVAEKLAMIRKDQKVAMIRHDQAEQFSTTVSYVNADLGRTIDGIIRETSTAAEHLKAQNGNGKAAPNTDGAKEEEEEEAGGSSVPPTSESLWGTLSLRGPERAKKQPPPDPENIFQARAKMRKEKTSKGAIPGLGRKDKKLVNEYVNRDIVSLFHGDLIVPL
jgi:hypothetical protein